MSTSFHPETLDEKLFVAGEKMMSPVSLSVERELPAACLKSFQRGLKMVDRRS
jgi:hypothetical protein